MIRFKKYVSVETEEDQTDVWDDPDEEEMGYLNLDNGRERHWRMVFEENGRGVDYEKAFLNAKRWYVYMNEK